jgi:hypothetical protein
MSEGIQIIDPEERFEVALEGAVLVMRRLDSATLMAIERRHAGERAKGRANDDVLDHILLDWRGVKSPLGQAEVPCTRENKLRLPTAVKLRLLAAAQAPRAEDMPDKP